MGKLADVAGRVYSGMTVLGIAGRTNGKTRWAVRCHCGNEVVMCSNSVRDLLIKSCGCLNAARSKARDITGQRFGKLTAIRQSELGKDRLWWVRCDCGVEKSLQRSHLIAGNIQSCGCLLVTHGLSRIGGTHPLYQTWANMISRCTNPRAKPWPNYGGRGIKVCDRWRGRFGFENFLADMGPRPRGHELDRYPDNDGNYEPGNCRWATRKQNIRNQRTNRRVAYLGQIRTIAEVSEMTGKPRGLLYARLRSGWDVESAISTPATKRKPHYRRSAAG